MLPTAKDWLNHLTAEARRAQLEHLDVLLDCAALPGAVLPTLLELTPAPLCAWLFEQTPEQELAHQGPVLLRIALHCPQQYAGILELLGAVHNQFCVLAIISRWPFADLAAHLGAATQATWSRGAGCGVLRYYDTRLFRHFCDQLDPHQRGIFHAPVIQWNWIDHDGKAATCSGVDTRPDRQNVPSGMSISDEQVLYMQSVSAALEWFKGYGKRPGEHGFTSGEAMIFWLITVHREISRQKLETRNHQDFIARALSELRPLTLTGNGGCL